MAQPPRRSLVHRFHCVLKTAGKVPIFCARGPAPARRKVLRAPCALTKAEVRRLARRGGVTRAGRRRKAPARLDLGSGADGAWRGRDVSAAVTLRSVAGGDETRKALRLGEAFASLYCERLPRVPRSHVLEWASPRRGTRAVVPRRPTL